MPGDRRWRTAPGSPAAAATAPSDPRSRTPRGTHVPMSGSAVPTSSPLRIQSSLSWNAASVLKSDAMPHLPTGNASALCCRHRAGVSRAQADTGGRTSPGLTTDEGRLLTVQQRPRPVVASVPVLDLLDPTAFDGGQPHDAFAWLRDNDPVRWHDEPDGPGFWAVTRYDDVKRVGRDAATFSSAGGIMIPSGTGLGQSAGAPRMMISMDPPDHTGFRRLVVPHFIPKAVRGMAPRLGALAAEIVDGVIERGECDLVSEVAGLMPSYVIAEMLGLPHADGVALYDLTEAIHSTPGPDEAGAGAGAGMTAF